MKNLLLVIECEENAKFMLEKSMIFSPESISLLCFLGSDQKEALDILSAKVDSIVKKQCETRLIIENAEKQSDKADKLMSIQNEIDYDMIMLHRPHLGKEISDYSLIKAILKSPSQSKVFLCGDIRWKPSFKVIATIDITDESEIHQSLNNKVIKVAGDISEKLKAELAVLSVLPISRISKELDIIEPEELLLKKRKASTTKLEAFVKHAGYAADTQILLSAGSPADEISSISKKKKASIVVLGSVGRTGLKGFFVGNTAEKILTHLMVDAVIVKQ